MDPHDIHKEARQQAFDHLDAAHRAEEALKQPHTVAELREIHRRRSGTRREIVAIDMPHDVLSVPSPDIESGRLPAEAVDVLFTREQQGGKPVLDEELPLGNIMTTEQPRKIPPPKRRPKSQSQQA